MALATIDTGTLVAVLTPLCVSIVGGGLAMAWRLGGLERTVKDLVGDIDRLDRKVDVLDAKADGAATAATATAAALSVITTKAGG